MMGIAWPRTLLAVLLLVVAMPARGAPAQESETLTLQELFDLARERNPRLRAAELRVEAVQTREPGAGLLPDPFVQLGVMNLALPEFSASMPASMAPVLSATQRFPLAGKLSIRGEIAHQSTQIQETVAREAWWEIRAQVASAFYRIYQVDGQVEVLGGTLGLLRDFETVAKALYASGTGRQADVLRASVEVARMESEIHRMVAQRRGAAARLNALLDQPASTPLSTPELGPLPLEVPDHGTLTQWASGNRPVLDGLRLEMDRAASKRELAGKEIWPDLTLGLQYGLGRMDGDPRSMGGASLGFSVPVYAGKRQRKLRDEAAAMERVAYANLEGALAVVDARVGEILAQLDQNRTLMALYREEILPQARAAVQSSFSAYRTGGVDFMTLVDAQMAVNRFEGEYFGLVASYGAALAELEMTIGRELPPTAELITENR